MPQAIFYSDKEMIDMKSDWIKEGMDFISSDGQFKLRHDGFYGDYMPQIRAGDGDELPIKWQNLSYDDLDIIKAKSICRMH